MPLTEFLIIKLGASVAKALAVSLLGEGLAGKVVPELAGPLEDWGKDRATRREAEKRLEKLGRQVAERIQPLLDKGFGRLEESRKNAVVGEAVKTLAKADITAELVVKFNLDREELYQHLLHSRPRATKGFSAEEVSLYERTLSEASGYILEIATHLAGFTGSAFAELLEGQDKVLGAVEKMAGASGEQAARFEERYRDSIKDRFDRMDLFGVRRVDQLQRRQSLSVSYITLQVERHAAVRATREPFAAAVAEALAQDSPLDARLQDEWRSGPVDRMLTRSRRLVVRGEAGSGKTTLLHWIAVRSARRDFPQHLASWNATVPLFIRLRECVKDGFPVPESLPALVAPMLAGSMPRGWVHDLLESGRALVLVDGVDELPREQRDPMRRRLAEMVSAFPLARYVVSSRPAALKADEWPEWQQWIEAEAFTEVALQPMGPEQIGSFVDHWHDAVGELIDPSERAEFERRPGNLKRLLRARGALRRLAASPLLCAMICALHRERGDRLPSERITLYKECCEMLLSLREDVRGIEPGGDYPDLSDPQKQTLIQSFAYWLMTNGWSDVEAAEADAHFETRLRLMNLPGVTGGQVRRYFVERSSLLREPVQERIDFAHRTFQEFMAAQEAVNNGDIGVLLKNAHDDQWREMIILAAGLARPKECERLLKGIINRGNKLKTEARRHRLHLLALACLETPVQIDPDVRAFVIKQAAPLFPPKNFDEALLVSSAGDPAVPFLTAKPEYDAGSSAACVRALTLIGSDKALTALESYSSDERASVCDEIGRSWDEFDRNDFARRVLSKAKKLMIPSLFSLEGFEHLSRLSYLRISEPMDLTEFVRLAPLLPGLTSLRFSCDNKVTDLQPLSVFSKLKDLAILLVANVIDLSALTKLPNLDYLFLNALISVKDISPLSELSRLTSLTIMSSDLVEDISPLSSLTDLTLLELIYCPRIADLRPLAALRQLKELSLDGCHAVVDVSPLSALTELAILDVTRTGVRDLRPLKGLKNLTIYTSEGEIKAADID
ncbi:MAG TPA: NACHT domain-containing protein [Pyrinomonadaceae bacterium]|nr:NACHT domain-containing protein [Pyrinomonadaceae bacterium]